MTDDHRPDPDLLLAQVQRQERDRRVGRLFIFLGMCPGVGKTYAMLLLGRQKRNEGSRVLVGVVETHGRAETAALLEGLDVLPRRKIEHGGHLLEEFDLDTALARRPEFLLVDELAHTNAPGSRHNKRYQDVLELLDAGIDVCTTLNVQHIESQVDIVRQITGVAVQETVPDSILDRAHEIQLVDLSVEKLLQRLAEGRVYLGERAEAAAEGFFREGNLTALREMALRFTAERVDRDLEDFRRARRDNSPWKTNARLLVGVAPTPYSESLVRWTRRAAARVGCPWIGVWVEGLRPLRPDEEELLARGLALVRKLGGEVVHVTGEDVATALLDVARDRNVSQIIVGKSDGKRRWKTTLTDRVIAGSGDIDVCVVRPLAGRRPPVVEAASSKGSAMWNDYGQALGLTAAVTLVCWVAFPFAGYTVPSFIYLLAIVLGSLRWQRGATLMMAAVSGTAWNFLFIPPRFTFHVDRPEDMAMLAMFFVVALAMGHLTTRLRIREHVERQRQRHTDALLRVTQQAALSPETGRGLEAALRVIESILGGQAVLLVRQDDHSLGRAAHPASAFQPSDGEFAVAAWAFANHQMAGRFTDTLPSAEATWFPLQTATSTMGVLGLKRDAARTTLLFTERQAMEAFALQLALVLEKEHFIEAVQHAERLEEGEKLRRALFDSVSHELKTPIAVIRATVETMAPDSCVAEIDTASRRLQRIVDGLLQMTRLEASVIEPKPEWCDVNDIISGALETIGDSLKNRPFTVDVSPDLPLVKTDHNLLEQCLANLLHNAAVHTSDGTAVGLSVNRGPKGIEIVVRDHGKGLPEGEEQRIFGKFYRSPGSPAGGTGLGLSIVKGFLRALGGEIVARNHPAGGAEFTIRLPAETMEPTAAALSVS